MHDAIGCFPACAIPAFVSIEFGKVIVRQQLRSSTYMKPAMSLYLDDSGTRHPDRRCGPPGRTDKDWFTLGGVLINDEDIDAAHGQLAAFRERWPKLGDKPLHSRDIRYSSKDFTWLADCWQPFVEDLGATLVGLPVIGVACVIDRPGYNSRYREKYGDQRWRLCKTAFCIVVERAAKFAIKESRRLRVSVERSSKPEEKAARDYYEQLRAKGNPFNSESSLRYRPLQADDFSRTLFEFRVRPKESRLTQVADLYLWPMAIGGYDPENRSFRMLRDSGKLIDSHLLTDEAPTIGIKYSCFEQVMRA